MSFLKKFNESTVISLFEILLILDNREIDLQLDNSSLESFLWMGITLALFKIVGNIPVEKGKSHIVARCLDIWSWKISALLVAVIMKESFFFIDKKLLKDLFETLILTEQSQQLMWKSYWKYFWLRLGHWCIFHHFRLWMVCHCFYVLLTLEI